MMKRGSIQGGGTAKLRSWGQPGWCVQDSKSNSGRRGGGREEQETGSESQVPWTKRPRFHPEARGRPRMVSSGRKKWPHWTLRRDMHWLGLGMSKSKTEAGKDSSLSSTGKSQ